MNVNRGDLVAIRSGCQEDCRLISVCEAMVNFDCSDVYRRYGAWCMCDESTRVLHADGFISWLESAGYIRRLPCKEWHVGEVFFGHDMALYDRLFS